MKKLMLSLAVISAISFTSCKSDDDNSGGEEQGSGSCQTCTIQSIQSEYCDNGDGTMTVTTAGQPTTISLEGASFSAFISALEQGGVTCQ